MVQNTPRSKLRVLVDANVLVAGIGWPRFPYEVLQHAFMGDYQLVLSELLISEARRIVARVVPERADVLDTFLDAVAYELVATPSSEEIYAHPELSRDQADIHVALAGIAAQADCLVSFDKDLTESDALKARLPVLLPPVFLRDYMGWTSEALEAIRHRRWQDLESPSERSTDEL